LEGARRLGERHEPEERPQSDQTRVAGGHRVGALLLEVVEELSQKRRVEILDVHARWWSTETIGCEYEQ
jgi:hypothetical protein